MQLQKKILGGPNRQARLAKSKTSAGAPILVQNRGNRARNVDDYKDTYGKEEKKNKKADYYKFYLDNAQKAIDLMIEQHKSKGSLQREAGM